MGVGSRFAVGTGTAVGVGVAGTSVGVGVAGTAVGVDVGVGVAGFPVGVGDEVDVGVAPVVGTGDGVVLVDAHAARIIAAISAIETITPFFMMISSNYLSGLFIVFFELSGFYIVFIDYRRIKIRLKLKGENTVFLVVG